MDYVWTAEGWLYVAAVIDLFSWRVVGWSMSAAMPAQLVTDALVMAIWRRGKPDAPLHHSDRGSQYTSEQFQSLMADHGVVCSMSRSGNVWDNAAMESFFSSLKTERTTRKLYRTRDEAKADVFDYACAARCAADLLRVVAERSGDGISSPGTGWPKNPRALAALPSAAPSGTTEGSNVLKRLVGKAPSLAARLVVWQRYTL
jgi:Integrase core domain